MNHCRASYEASRRRRAEQPPSAVSRMIGPLMVLLAAGIWPTAVFAADATVDTQRNAIVVFIVIILLLGSVAAGVFFASPLRKRLIPSTTDGSASDVQRERRTVIAPREAFEAEPLVTRYVPLPEPVAEPRPAVPLNSWPQPAQHIASYAPPIPEVEPRPAHLPPWIAPATSQEAVAPETPRFAPPPSEPIYQPQPVYQPQPAYQQPAVPQQPTPPQAQPQTGVPQPPPPRPGSAAWSTGDPTPDTNWHPGRR